MPSTAQQRAFDIHAAFNRGDASAPWLMCDRHPADKVAFRFVDDDLQVRDTTYGELAQRSRRAAQFLSDRGIGPGDRVASLLGKGPDLPALILGIWRLGAVYVPLFTAFAADAVAERVADAAVALVVTDRDQVAKVRGLPVEVVLAGTTATGNGGDLDDLRDLGSALVDGPEWAATTPVSGPQTPIVQMATSGTTGKPKIVVQPLAYAAGWQAYVEIGLAPGESLWCGADPGWAYGLYSLIIGPLASGISSIFTCGSFKPELTWRVLGELRVSDYAAAPTALRALRACDPGVDLPALRRLSTAGEPLPPDLGEWARRRFGLDVHDHFGQTELGMTAGFAHHPDLDGVVVARAMGASLPGWSTTVLGATTDEPAPAGEIGRLAIDIPNSPFFTFTGYGAARDVRGPLTADGQHYLTGDLASIGHDGLIRFSSRDDDVILMAGYRIGPFDVESVLVGHPEVAECAVVATPDKARGEVVHAYVVPASAPSDPTALVSELQDWVRTRYAAHAYPRLVTFVDALPKTPSGKVRREALRAAGRSVDHHRATPARRSPGPMSTPPSAPGTDEQARREAELLERVLRSFDDCQHPRLKELMQGVVRHLHAFITDVRLTDAEWSTAIDFLTAVGHITDDRRQEFILLSDTLGASMQTINVNNEAYRDATEATVFGPFFVEDAPFVEDGGDIAGGAAGEPCWVEGTVTDTDGNPVAGARIEVWEADADGFYDVQYDDGRTTARGHLLSGPDGSFRFWAITPTPYPIPHDGPVGRMLAAVGRSPLRAAHLHFMVSAPRLRTLVTHIFVRGDELLGSDTVFGVKDSLVKDFERQPAGTPAPAGRSVDGTWSRTRFDIVLAPAEV